MRHKLFDLARELEPMIRQSGDMIGLVLMETDLDPLDPYFVVSLDAYVHGRPLASETRGEIFSVVGAYEGREWKDRFMFHDLPVRIEYKDIAQFDELRTGQVQSFLDNSYALRRLLTGIVLADESGIIQELRTAAGAIDSEFWRRMTLHYFARLEHYHEDMGAAAKRNDGLNFILSKAGYLESVLGALCGLNQAFMPASRDMNQIVDKLLRQPDGFMPKFRTLVSWNSEPMERQAELAGILARMLLSVGIEP